MGKVKLYRIRERNLKIPWDNKQGDSITCCIFKLLTTETLKQSSIPLGDGSLFLRPMNTYITATSRWSANIEAERSIDYPGESTVTTRLTREEGDRRAEAEQEMRYGDRARERQ